MSNIFISQRNQYLPEKISVIFVLESPPEGHGYFYDCSGCVSEVLFRAFMKLLRITPITKAEGLLTLKRKGWLLVNPIYKPVNKLSDKEADKMILNNYKNFKEDLKSLLGKNKKTPIILVKSNILRLLEKPLLEDGFNVLNDGVLIPFPLHYHAKAFQDKITNIWKKKLK